MILSETSLDFLNKTKTKEAVINAFLTRRLFSIQLAKIRPNISSQLHKAKT